VDYPWIRANGADVEAAYHRHKDELDRLAPYIHSKPVSRLTLAEVGLWIRQRAEEGCRLIVVDPITAASAGDKRWLADDDFVIGIQNVLGETGSSLILITHSKKGNRPGNPTGHDQGMGAAYFRFSDSDLWLLRTKKPRRVELRRTKLDMPWNMSLELFVQIHKSRLGRGAGKEIGFTFGDGLMFAEQGVVTKDLPEMKDPEAA
jgi:hypothetical protein